MINKDYDFPRLDSSIASKHRTKQKREKETIVIYCGCFTVGILFSEFLKTNLVNDFTYKISIDECCI